MREKTEHICISLVKYLNVYIVSALVLCGFFSLYVWNALRLRECHWHMLGNCSYSANGIFENCIGTI